MRLIGYVRVSQVRGREGESFISPDVQRERVEAHARAGGHVVTEWVEDLDQPGSKDDRPGFQRALEAVERGEAGGIAVAKLNRFSRSTTGAARALERLEKVGGVLLAADLGMDTSTPTGKLMRNVIFALGEFELDLIRENWNAATEKAISRGVYISGRVPVGYVRGEDGRLAVDPAGAEAVRYIFRARGAGESWRTICEHLDREHPQEGATWTAQRCQWIARNRCYLGEAKQGTHVNPDAHEPLVTRLEWEAARPAKRQEWRGEPRMLSGVARCGSCGYALRKDYSRASFPRYSCGGRKAKAVCAHPVTIGSERLDAFVSAAFLERIAAEPVSLDAVAIGDALGARVAALEQAEAELAAFRATNLVTVLGVEAFEAGIRERADAVNAASGQLVELRRGQPALTPGADVAGEWPGMSVAERRALIEATTRGVFVFPASGGNTRAPVAERVRIAWVGDDDPLPVLPGLAD
jgi:DNA invertase Pin-like site-specific DNA recombinase